MFVFEIHLGYIIKIINPQDIISDLKVYVEKNIMIISSLNLIKIFQLVGNYKEPLTTIFH